MNLLTNDTQRLATTALIWCIVGLISIIGILADGLSFGAVMVILFGLVFASMTTKSLWTATVENPDDTRRERRAERVSSEKPKRSRAGDTKAEMLLALMDDDEREAFKRALQQRMLAGASRLADDGELAEDDVSIETLERLLADDYNA